MAETAAPASGRWYASMSQKRYQVLEAAIMKELGQADLVKRVMQRVCESLSYDPAAKQYSAERGKVQYESRKRVAAAKGFSSARAYTLATAATRVASTLSVSPQTDNDA